MEKIHKGNWWFVHETRQGLRGLRGCTVVMITTNRRFQMMLYMQVFQA